jgi:hypothetical protein
VHSVLNALIYSSGKHPEQAIQHIVLSGGKDYGDIFCRYKQAVDGMIKFVHRTLGVPEIVREPSDVLFVGRRVFTKVAIPISLSPSAPNQSR